MLKNILSPKTCADCKICCIFDKYDVWETPVISGELHEKIKLLRPELEFVSKGDTGSYMFNMELAWDEEEEIYRCPALDCQTGCTLGENKPFDCRIWPYRIMRLGESLVISIASICPEMYKKPLNALVEELENGLGEVIFREAEKNPAIVKPYEHGYPILMVSRSSDRNRVSLTEVKREDISFISSVYNDKETLEALKAEPISIEEWTEDFEQWREDSGEENYIIRCGTEPAGWLKINGLDGGEYGLVSVLVVGRKYRRMGLACEALKFAENIFSERGLDASVIHAYADNEALRRCCGVCGYTVASGDPDDSEERLMYVKKL